jgi:hypothetical protein
MKVQKKVIALIICTIVLFSITGYILWDRIFSDNSQNSMLDFSNTTDNTAWYGYIEICNTSYHTAGRPDGFKDNIFNSDEYEKISGSDNQNMICQTPGNDSGFPYFLFEFKIIDLTSEIKLNYEGYSSQPFMGTVENEITISIFNYNTQQWEELIDRNTNDEIDYDISCTITENISNYLNNSCVNILVIGTYGAGNSNSTLSCDYVAIVNSHIIEE